MKTGFGMLTAALLLISCGTGQAATVTVTSVSGVWSDVDPNVATGVGTTSIRWGQSTGFGRSGYDFVSNVPPPQVLGNGQQFDLATFTHINQPITGNAIEKAWLDVTINFTADFLVGPQVANQQFIFLHNETPNACIGLNCSDDIVKAFLNVGQSNVYVDGLNIYTFGITGFEVGNVLFSQFNSPEGSSNSATLRASFDAVENFPSETPLPAAVWLFGSALGLGALLTRQRRQRKRGIWDDLPRVEFTPKA
jgi:hypothetical protein